MIHDSMERVFEDPIFFLPLEGNIIVAQDQQLLYTYHKWREGQCGVGYFFYHVQLFSLTTLQEPKVEQDFQELPCWEVTHFVWMIAWGWRIHMGMMVPNEFQIPCLKGTSIQHLISSLSTLVTHDDSYLASLHAWEGKYGDLLMRQHLITWMIISYVDATVGGGETQIGRAHV